MSWAVKQRGQRPESGSVCYRLDVDFHGCLLSTSAAARGAPQPRALAPLLALARIFASARCVPAPGWTFRARHACWPPRHSPFRRKRRDFAGVRGRIAGDVAITEPLGRLPRRVPRSFRNRARRDALAHVAAELIPQARIRIGNACAMLRIVRPYAGAMRVAKVSGVEIVLVNEGVIHDHPCDRPIRDASPSRPSRASRLRRTGRR